MSGEGPAYTLLIAAHVLAALVGFGTILLTAVYATMARRAPSEQTVQNYFRPGTNWPARSLYAVPVLGLMLVKATNGTYDLAQGWIVASLAISCLVIALAQLVVWPGERTIGAALIGSGGASGMTSAELKLASSRVASAAVVIEIGFVVTVVLMVLKPGGP